MNVGGSNRRSRKKRGPMAEINVVPYIDVTFVLLMIFMITAPLVQTGVDVDLPEAEAESVDLQDQTPVIVSIRKDGTFYVDIGNGDEEADTPVDVETVKSRVATVFKNNPKAQLYVRGDHENHQQYKGNVNIGNDVDFGHRAAFFPRSAVAATYIHLLCACLCNNTTNSSMNNS